MIDLDAPYEDRRVSSLHWLVTGLTISSSSPSTENPSSLNIPSSAQVPWQPPNPPIGDIAHTYAIYLIAPVPSNLDIPAELSRNRTPFDLKQWLQERDLEENVVARNYFRIRNLKGTPTAVFPGPRPSETAPLVRARPTGTTGTEGEIENGVGRVGAKRVKSLVAMAFLSAVALVTR